MIKSIVRGDSYAIALNINFTESQVLPDDCDEIELIINKIRKTLSNNEIYYQNGKWYFRLSQKETFSFPTGEIPYQIRVYFVDGDCRGSSIQWITIEKVLSDKELGNGGT